jgi:hypothetical protein
MLQRNLAQRCVHHWKARVDHKADWRAFQAGAVTHMARAR